MLICFEFGAEVTGVTGTEQGVIGQVNYVYFHFQVRYELTTTSVQRHPQTHILYSWRNTDTCEKKVEVLYKQALKCTRSIKVQSSPGSEGHVYCPFQSIAK